MSPDIINDITPATCCSRSTSSSTCRVTCRVLMYLQATNMNTAGGGLPILTGPGFVDKDNVDAVKALVDKGTR